MLCDSKTLFSQLHPFLQVSLERRKRDLEAEVQAEVAASQQQPAATSTTSLPAAALSEQGRQMETIRITLEIGNRITGCYILLMKTSH